MQGQPRMISARENKARVPQPGKRQRLTQQAIIAGAAELFAERGFGATSLDDIAEKLGAGKASLYYHVKNKEEILRLIFLTVLTASEEPLRRIAEANLPPREKLGRAIEHQTVVAADRSPAMTVFSESNSISQGRSRKKSSCAKKPTSAILNRLSKKGRRWAYFGRTPTPKSSPSVCSACATGSPSGTGQPVSILPNRLQLCS